MAPGQIRYQKLLLHTGVNRDILQFGVGNTLSAYAVSEHEDPF